MEKERPTKKIAFGVSSLGGGGAERVIVNLANELVAQGYNVDIVVKYKRGAYLNMLDSRVRVIGLFETYQGSVVKKAMEAFYNYRDYVRESSAAAILTTNRDFNIHIWILQVLTGSKLPHLFREASTLNGTYFSSNSIGSVIGRLLMRVAYRKSSMVIVNSEATKEDLVKKLGVPHKKIEVIFNPVVLRSYKKKYGAARKVFLGAGPKLVTCGRLVKSKNQGYLIECFSRLLKSWPESELMVIGEGPEKSRLQKKIKDFSLVERCHLIGFVENPEDYISQADVFVLTSLYEGSPNVLSEAMACRVPIVAVDARGGMREILENGKYGELVPEDDMEALVGAIKRQYIDPTPKHILEEGRERFDSRRIAGKYTAAIERVAGTE